MFLPPALQWVALADEIYIHDGKNTVQSEISFHDYNRICTQMVNRVWGESRACFDYTKSCQMFSCRMITFLDAIQCSIQCSNHPML